MGTKISITLVQHFFVAVDVFLALYANKMKTYYRQDSKKKIFNSHRIKLKLSYLVKEIFFPIMHYEIPFLSFKEKDSVILFLRFVIFPWIILYPKKFIFIYLLCMDFCFCCF